MRSLNDARPDDAFSERGFYKIQMRCIITAVLGEEGAICASSLRNFFIYEAVCFLCTVFYFSFLSIRE